VDLSSSTTTTTVTPKFAVTDNTGAAIDGQYEHALLDSALTVTSTEDCTITIQVLNL